MQSTVKGLKDGAPCPALVPVYDERGERVFSDGQPVTKPCTGTLHDSDAAKAWDGGKGRAAVQCDTCKTTWPEQKGRGRADG